MDNTLNNDNGLCWGVEITILTRFLEKSDFDELGNKIVEASSQNSLVSLEIKKYLSARGWKEEIKYWMRCYNNLLNEC